MNDGVKIWAVFLHVLPRGCVGGCVCACVAGQCSAVTPSRRCCAKQLLAFMARSRTRAMAANISVTRPVNRSQLAVKPDAQTEVWHHFTYVAPGEGYTGVFFLSRYRNENTSVFLHFCSDNKCLEQNVNKHILKCDTCTVKTWWNWFLFVMHVMFNNCRISPCSNPSMK